MGTITLYGRSAILHDYSGTYPNHLLGDFPVSNEVEMTQSDELRVTIDPIAEAVKKKAIKKTAVSI